MLDLFTQANKIKPNIKRNIANFYERKRISNFKKFRRIFKNTGYKTYLVNEFITSKLYNHCREEIKPFLERKSNKPKLIKD